MVNMQKTARFVGRHKFAIGVAAFLALLGSYFVHKQYQYYNITPREQEQLAYFAEDYDVLSKFLIDAINELDFNEAWSIFRRLEGDIKGMEKEIPLEKKYRDQLNSYGVSLKIMDNFKLGTNFDSLIGKLYEIEYDGGKVPASVRTIIYDINSYIRGAKRGIIPDLYPAFREYVLNQFKSSFEYYVLKYRRDDIKIRPLITELVMREIIDKMFSTQ